MSSSSFVNCVSLLCFSVQITSIIYSKKKGNEQYCRREDEGSEDGRTEIWASSLVHYSWTNTARERDTLTSVRIDRWETTIVLVWVSRDEDNGDEWDWTSPIRDRTATHEEKRFVQRRRRTTNDGKCLSKECPREMNTNEERQSTDDDSIERRPNNYRLDECDSQIGPREVHRANLPDETSDKHAYRRRMKQLTLSTRTTRVTSQMFFFHFLSPRLTDRKENRSSAVLSRDLSPILGLLNPRWVLNAPDELFASRLKEYAQDSLHF